MPPGEMLGSGLGGGIMRRKGLRCPGDRPTWPSANRPLREGSTVRASSDEVLLSGPDVAQGELRAAANEERAVVLERHAVLARGAVGEGRLAAAAGGAQVGERVVGVGAAAEDDDHLRVVGRRAPVPVVVMAGGGARQAVPLPEEIDRRRLAVVARVDGGVPLLLRRQRAV